MSKIGRNDPCHCGSGQKYKKCCSAQDAAKANAELADKARERAEERAKAEEAAQAEAEGTDVKADARNKGASGAKPASAGGGRRPKQPAATPPPAFRRRAV